MPNPLLSIILVNYRVPHFLEQCLLSVERAASGIDVEVLVVDNASGDGSIEWLSPKFPGVRFIASDQNIGFARASNLAYQESTGEYVLFLNPDTLLTEEALRRPIEFLKTIPNAGALGIKMIDGNGKFLPESKRAFPDPLTAFYKIIGLSKLFPRSPRFARYHLGHLSPSQNHAIDVVSGAYFLVKREVLQKTGAFDEQFFMYGEDVDLSYRIQKAGYVNYYFAETPILHFKGESTQKESLRYVRLFYGAMSQFVSKHQLHPGWFRAGIQIAIALRAGLSVFKRMVRAIGILTIDSLLILVCFFTIQHLWSSYVRPDVIYPPNIRFAVAWQAIVFFFVGLLTGLYRKPFRWTNFFKTTALSGGLLLAAYSLLPETLRFSRGVVAFSSILSMIVLAAWRQALLYLHLLSTERDAAIQFPLLVIGSSNACEEIRAMYPDKPAAAFLHIDPLLLRETLAEKTRSLREIISFNDVVFCPGTISYSEVLQLLQAWSGRYTFRFHVEGSQYIIGTNCSATPYHSNARKG